MAFIELLIQVKTPDCQLDRELEITTEY